MKNIVLWVLKLTVAIILLQTLYFKFTAHPDSVHIFSALGVEPFGRIGLGIIELITAGLILYPRTSMVGMVLSLGIIVGAIGSHLLVLGLEVEGDGGGLFSLALVVLIADLLYFAMQRLELNALFLWMRGKLAL
jgi:hypothetical protein